MRKLVIAGFAVASLTGIAYGQGDTQREDELIKKLSAHVIERESGGGPTCVDPDGVPRQIGETTQILKFNFKCVDTFGDRVRSNGANWIQIEPLRSRYVTLD